MIEIGINNTTIPIVIYNHRLSEILLKIVRIQISLIKSLCSIINLSRLCKIIHI